MRDGRVVLNLHQADLSHVFAPTEARILAAALAIQAEAAEKQPKEPLILRDDEVELLGRLVDDLRDQIRKRDSS